MTPLPEDAERAALAEVHGPADELDPAAPVERDGQAALKQWEAWMAAEDRYRSTERPDERADLVVRGDCNLWK